MNGKFTFVNRREKPKNYNLAEQINNFLRTKKLEKRSDQTIQTYKHTLDQFHNWMQKREDKTISADTLRNYIHYLAFEKRKWDDHPTNHTQGIGLSPKSVNNNIRNLKIFFKFLLEERIITESPMTSIRYQKDSKDTFEIFTDDDVIALLKIPNRRVYTGMRDYCMMLVLIDTGLRIKELTNLKISDVIFNMNQIIVRSEVSKTNATRIVPISQKTTKELQRLVDILNVEDDDYLWLTQFGERYFADTFGKMLKNYGKKAQITGARVSPHTFRHYFAVKFLREGGDPFALSRILGHTTLDMTQTYVKYTATDLGEQHKRSSPVMNLLDNGNEKKSGKVRFK